MASSLSSSPASDGKELKRCRTEPSPEDTLVTAPSSVSTITNAVAYEQQYVHEVYDAIASHFSSTRYKAWPQVRQFIQSLPPFTLIADIGCGNGKYFGCAQELLCSPTDPLSSSGAKRKGEEEGVEDEAPGELPSLPTRRYMVGLDYSEALLRSTQRELMDPNIVAVTAAGDARRSERKHGHLEKRSSQSDETAASSLTPPGLCGFPLLPKTDTIRSEARCCPLRGGVFDAAISIAVIHHFATAERRREAVRELLRLVRPHGGRVLIYVWALEQPARPNRVFDRETGDGLIRWEMHAKFVKDNPRTFHRYYHFFKKGELEELCLAAAAGIEASSDTDAESKDDAHHGSIPIQVVRSYYDKENWCVVVQRD